MFNFTSSSIDPVRLNKIIEATPDVITDEDFVINEIDNFLQSKERKEMITGELYYEGEHDILKAKREVIGEGGEMKEIEHLPNNRNVDNQYKKMVDQKKNYLLGKPIIFSPKMDSESKTNEESDYSRNLKELFGRKFQRLMKNIGEDSLNCGIGWMFVNYNRRGEFAMKRMKPYQVIPIWSDFEHDELDGIIYFYTYKVDDEEIQKVEVYDETGVYYFVRDKDKLIAEKPHQTHFEVSVGDGESQGFNWLNIPWIPFKYNNKEIPLIRDVKSLQDAINRIISTFNNNMTEDHRNSIYVLVNFDGENLGEFRRNLSQYGAVKVRSNRDTGGGDVKTLQVEVDAQNYESILKIFKNALIENAKGYDAKDDRLAGAPNQMNIQSMYSDVDLHADEMETEYQAAFEGLMEFVNVHLTNTEGDNCIGEMVDVIFNRNVLINETEIITNLRNSVGLISDETIIEHHPFVDNVQDELLRIQNERERAQSNMDPYRNAFNIEDDVIDDEDE